ncbi:hypothetical protein H5410_003895 [Solanum commersonii]|uniref:F-box associated beta-propeller type 1 domain-containing protein n=1 Tax=Solanum commersonii TaxID=4109 RepID=A0A9J6B6E9_SOLCO|nr:hypothetical protein H5410_003895 [Solanum commersonii]
MNSRSKEISCLRLVDGRDIKQGTAGNCCFPAVHGRPLMGRSSEGHGEGESFRRCIEGVGFGFDQINNDYKVVKIAEVYTDPPYRDPDARKKKIKVYDVCIDSWRESDHVDQQFPSMYYLPCSQIFYKDSCHWFAIPNTEDIVSILCFDITTEVFHVMKMPNNYHSFGRTCYALVILSECLTLICYPDSKSDIDPTQDLMDIWIMREYGVYESWFKKYTIGRRFPIESPLGVWKHNILTFQSTTGYLIFYDLNSGKTQEFSLRGSPRSLRVASYKENLNSIPGGAEPAIPIRMLVATLIVFWNQCFEA